MPVKRKGGNPPHRGNLILESSALLLVPLGTILGHLGLIRGALALISGPLGLILAPSGTFLGHLGLIWAQKVSYIPTLFFGLGDITDFCHFWSLILEPLRLILGRLGLIWEALALTAHLFAFSRVVSTWYPIGSHILPRGWLTDWLHCLLGVCC